MQNEPCSETNQQIFAKFKIILFVIGKLDSVKLTPPQFLLCVFLLTQIQQSSRIHISTDLHSTDYTPQNQCYSLSSKLTCTLHLSSVFILPSIKKDRKKGSMAQQTHNVGQKGGSSFVHFGERPLCAGPLVDNASTVIHGLLQLHLLVTPQLSLLSIVKKVLHVLTSSTSSFTSIREYNMSFYIWIENK